MASTSQTMSPSQQKSQAFQATVAGRYSQMQGSEFRAELGNAWKALDDVVNTVIDNVENQNLKPIDGIRAVAALTGSVFGYEEFHPRTGQPTLSTILSGSDSQQS